jgi:hypothetical protein
VRTVSESATVRLYFLDEGEGGAQTLMYGPLGDALAMAHAQPADVQEGLYLATDNDVVAFLDLEEG